MTFIRGRRCIRTEADLVEAFETEKLVMAAPNVVKFVPRDTLETRPMLREAIRTHGYWKAMKG